MPLSGVILSFSKSCTFRWKSAKYRATFTGKCILSGPARSIYGSIGTVSSKCTRIYWKFRHYSKTSLFWGRWRHLMKCSMSPMWGSCCRFSHKGAGISIPWPSFSIGPTDTKTSHYKWKRCNGCLTNSIRTWKKCCTKWVSCTGVAK